MVAKTRPEVPEPSLEPTAPVLDRVVMHDPEGQRFEIVPEGVQALEALGWTRLERARV